MERKSSILYELRGNQKKEPDHAASTHQWTSGLGMMASVSWILMMMVTRPQVGLMIGGLAAIILLASIYRRTAKAKEKVYSADSQLLRSYRISRVEGGIQSLHLGHSAEVRTLLGAIDRGLSLASQHKSLGVHLIGGPAGTGKTQLSRLIAKNLFGNNGVIEFDFESLDRTTFSEQFLEMLSAIEKQPYRVVLLENIEAMDIQMLEPFLEIFSSNEWKSGDATTIRFTGCLFFLTSKLSASDRSGSLSPKLISHISERVDWGPLSREVMAELACRQIYDYWIEHAIHVDWVSPDVILGVLTELQTNPTLGMHLLPQVVRNRSNRALGRAVDLGPQRVTLHLDKYGALVANVSIRKVTQRKRAGEDL